MDQITQKEDWFDHLDDLVFGDNNAEGFKAILRQCLFDKQLIADFREWGESRMDRIAAHESLDPDIKFLIGIQLGYAKQQE